MQIYINEKSIKRKAKLGTILTIGGLAVMLLCAVLTFQQPEYYNVLFPVVIAAVLACQAGVVVSRRWGQSPRVDEILDACLKGLDSRFMIFHYRLGADHALICPTGVYALVPVYEDGELFFDGEDWWQVRKKRKKEKLSNISRISKDAAREARKLSQALTKHLPDLGDFPVQSVFVLVRSDSTLRPQEIPFLAVHAKKIKPFLRKLSKKRALTEDQAAELINTVNS